VSLAKHEIVQMAAQHALLVHENPDKPGLTPYGIATCAASAAYVLAHEDHPNHQSLLARLAPAMTEEDSHGNG
jgi:hypothetical protein